MPDASFLDGPIPGRTLGEDAQVLELSLEAGQRLTCEGSAVLYLLGDVNLSLEWGEGMMTPLWRKYAGEDLLLTDVVAHGNAVVGLSPPEWGRIVRIPLRDDAVVFTSRGAYMAHTGRLEMQVAFTRRLRAGLFGSKGVVFQRHHGHGDLFIHAYGHVLCMDLPANQSIRVSPGNVLAFEGSVGLDAQLSAGLLTMLMGRQEAVLDELRGPGRIWLQSLDIAPTVVRQGKPAHAPAAARPPVPTR